MSLSMIIYASVKPMFKIYFIIALGFLLAKKNILTVSTCRDISNAVVTAIMPCLIFNNIVSNLKSSDIKDIGIIFFTGTLLFIFGVLLSLLVMLTTNAPVRWRGGLLLVGLFPNISDLPIAYLQSFSKGGNVFSVEQGEKGVAYVCIFLASQVFYQFSLGLYRLIEWDFREELLESSDTEQCTKSIDGERSSTETETELEHKQSREQDPEANESGQLNQGTDSKKEGSEENASEKRGSSPEKSSKDGRVGAESLKTRDTLQASYKTAEPESNTEDTSLSDNASESEQHFPATEVDNDDSRHYAFLLKHDRAGSADSEAVSTESSIPSASSSPQALLRRRRNSNASQSACTNLNSLELVPTRINTLRLQRSQDIGDVISEFSEYPALRQELTKTSGIPPEESTGILMKTKIKYKLIETLKNFATPNSASLIIAIAIAMSPPLKALFVSTTFYMPNAPDQQPPLSFFIDIVSYVGAASVPLGLLLLGATISRLRINSMPKGFWKTGLGLTVARLILLPIIGVGVTIGFREAGWYGSDKLIHFVSVLEFGLPSATALVYFTAFYTNPESEEHLQMDCLAVCLIFQYAILIISLPFLVSFTLKVPLGF